MLAVHASVYLSRACSYKVLPILNCSDCNDLRKDIPRLLSGTYISHLKSAALDQLLSEAHKSSLAIALPSWEKVLQVLATT